MKPPYYQVKADCPKCGPVQVQRKPHRLAGQRLSTGAIVKPEPQGIVCVCGYHAKVTSAKLVPPKEEVAT